MGDKTGIEWTQATWNPTVGCDRISPGCARCYAKTLHDKRHKAFLKGKYVAPQYAQPFEVLQLLENRLDAPLRKRKPTTYFVNSVSDLFHEDVPDAFIDRVFDVMWRSPQHTFQILTKRVPRMVKYIRERAAVRRFGWTDWERSALRPGDIISLTDIRMRNECGYVGEADWSCDHPQHGGKAETCSQYDCPIAQCVYEREKLAAIGVADDHTYGSDGCAEDSEWMEFHERPPHAACGNVWLGFSAENQRMFDERMRQFRELRWILGPHFTLFASLEPLLGPIDFAIPYWPPDDEETAPWNALSKHEFSHGQENHDRPYLDWVIVGGESGPGARPFDVAWARSIVAQCQAADVPVFMKQLGAHVIDRNDAGFEGDNPGAWPMDTETEELTYRFCQGDPVRVHLRDRKGGDPQEWPADLRVRQFPRAAVQA